MWRIEEKYRADRMWEKTEPCSTPMSTLKEEDKNHSRDILFFFLLSNHRKITRSWSQTLLCQGSKKATDGWVMGRTG